jgi:hypothetical protein
MTQMCSQGQAQSEGHLEDWEWQLKKPALKPPPKRPPPTAFSLKAHVSHFPAARRPF